MVRWCAGYREWGLRPDARTTVLCAAIEPAVRTARAPSEEVVVNDRGLLHSASGAQQSVRHFPTDRGRWLGQAQAPFAAASTQAHHSRRSRRNL